MKEDTSRYFVFLLYPDSSPVDWEMRLEMTGMPIAISPLHDKDPVKKGGGLKKGHYHGIYVSKNSITASAVRKRLQRALGSSAVNKVQIVQYGMESAYLYLTHESKDAIAKNKYVYPKSEIKHLNNFDIERYVVLDVEEKEELFDKILSIVAENQLANILELRAFVEKYGSRYGLAGMKQVNSIIAPKTGLMRMYFDASYQVRKSGQLKEVDLDTIPGCKKSSFPPGERGECEEVCHCYDDESDGE